MKVIICGAGQVGWQIARHLSSEKNDVTVVDNNSELVSRAVDTLDVNGIAGNASYPDVLSMAGAGDADMIIAATYSDEVNMVTCQVAHSVFKIPRKIARLRGQSYLDAIYSDLYQRDHLPIDVVISPEKEVAIQALRQLRYPGTFDTEPFMEGKVELLGLILTEECNVLNTSLRQLSELFPNLRANIVAIRRNGALMVPDSQEQLIVDDQVYVCTNADDKERCLEIFGKTNKKQDRVIIIGGGNVGRNTTIIRSNYMHDDNALFSEFGMDLWRKMSQDLNYNVMFSPRGIINLAHSDAQMNVYARRGNSMRLNGIDAVLLNREQVKEIIPMADFSENVRFPIFGGLMQPSAGTARHDAVAWGYARQADSMGVDIIQNCEVTGFDVSGGKINGVRTSRGDIKVKKIGLCVAGSTNVLAEKLNMTLPIETHLLQACVSEPVKPILDRVVTFGAGHFYISQSDKGEMVMGGDLDGYNSYAQRGNLPTLQHVLTEGIAMMPFLSKLKMLRTWGGIMDMSMDGSPIIDKTHIEGLYLNCGWCYGGFKATPASGWTFAHTIAQDRVHKLNAGYSLNRFSTGHLLDEKGLGTKTWIS